MDAWLLHTEILHREMWPSVRWSHRGLGSGQSVPVWVCLELKRTEDSVVNCQTSVAYLFDHPGSNKALHCCAGFSLGAESWDCSLIVVRGLLIGVAFLVVEKSLSLCGLQ